MSYFLLILIFVSPAFAGLDKIAIKNLDLDYVYPQGTGLVEKVSVGIAIEKSETAYPVEIFRRDNAFDVTSTFVDFQWLDPIPFVHNMLKAKTEKLNLKVDKNDHYLNGDLLRFTGEKTGEVVLKKYKLTCKGPSVSKDPVERLKTDCLEKLEAHVSYMELPFQFLTDLASQLPDVPTETEGDIPANDFGLTVTKGDYYSYLRIKYVVNAYLKFWGHVKHENDGKTLAIRIDLVKFGILPVTALVMNQLRRQINHPRVTITPPWIRIKLGNE
ncbi:MAG: hypothetical protein H0V66_16150 [Bdellovibrionales bacterium]|nr:hypothetical protein [Bdellovibrionales bacterium]